MPALARLAYRGRVLTPPAGLLPGELRAALDRGWGLATAGLDYLPVGFGSHHWALRSTGGEPLVSIGSQFSVALYPLLAGQFFEWGQWSGPAHRRGVLDLLVAVHIAPPAVTRRARADDLAISRREDLEQALAGQPAPPSGPFARPAAELLARNGAVRALLARYDGLVARCRDERPARVLTHGEPHPGNTLLTDAGWRLIDWDTARTAPPERDLWLVDPGDGSVLAAYAEATGTPPRPWLAELFAARWDLTDIALAAAEFREPHSGDANDARSFDLLVAILNHLAS
jgi:spectinomycin phosphotransferase/16S rRNA (guanine(1405)-N(7))-methyltransferase